jgi:carotenoid cleavage dioxygenase-like enzyme
MTAHPRVDPVNGDLIFYQCGMFEKPYLRYSVIDRYGKHQIWKMGVEIGKAKMRVRSSCIW